MYSSFQPGMVDPMVRDLGAKLVQSGEVVEKIAEKYGLDLVDRKADEARPQVDIIISYNPVKGYVPGMHGDGRLLVVAYEKFAEDEAPRVLWEAMDRLYAEHDWREDRDLVRNVFIYDGVNGGDVPARMAATLEHDLRKEVYVLACHCDWERKERFAEGHNIQLYGVGCGGEKALGYIADAIMGKDVPDDALPMPRELILGEARKERI